jgi:hypothetical protein
MEPSFAEADKADPHPVVHSFELSQHKGLKDQRVKESGGQRPLPGAFDP